MSNLDSIFSSHSIAVVGASSKPNTVGQSIFSNLLFSGYCGVLYPVNPKAKSISGVRCYANVKEIPGELDLGIFIVPSVVTAQALLEAADKGIKAAIVISAGFKEIGGEGVKREEELKRIVKEHGIKLVGPNCLGVINTDPDVMMNASFAKTMPKEGNISFVSQSGALCTAVLDYAKGNNFGFAKFISIGNKADVNEIDLLKYLHKDPKTDVILMYVEDLMNGYEFIQVARDITGNDENPKPILAIKSGRTDQGAKAASSHTGSLAGSDEVYEAIFNQAGIIRAERVEELFDLAIAFAQQPLPRGKRVAIVTNAGGPGILATDSCIRSGLELASFEETTVEELKKHLPPTANFSNPIDVIGDARHDRYHAALSAVCNDPNVDSVITILTPQDMTDIEDIAWEIVNTSKSCNKPLLANFMGIIDVSKGVQILEENEVPTYIFPESAAKALASMYDYTQWCSRPRTEVRKYDDVDGETVRKIFEKVRQEKRVHLPEIEALEVLKAYGFPTLPSELATSADDALKAAKKMGYPVVLKIVSPDIIHKVDVGGVVVGIDSHNELLDAYLEMTNSVAQKAPKAKLWGVNVQKMASSGTEVIVGMNRDQKFGPLIMFGLGGTFVEALRDVTFRFVPILELGAYRMIQSIRSYKMLEAFRGKKAKDIHAIADIIMRLSQLIMDFPEIQEFDMNPIMVYEEGEGCKVADVRIILNK
ncbi:MAG: acetate--CoA ligase family protein [Candidatus Latescibacterota bacterium]|nr:MAG: acetate--CoA ligase family protein [Candidatus Latescibacterota bacterium]